MSRPLDDVIDGLAGERRELVAVNASEGAPLDDVMAYFDRLNLSDVTRVDDPALPTETLLATDGDRCLGAVDLGDLHAYLFDSGVGTGALTDGEREASGPAGDSPTGANDVGPLTEIDVAGVQQSLARLDNRVYTVTGEARTPMVGVSRHIEQRALAAGEGTVHAGFQRLSRLRDKRHTLDTYLTLAERGMDTNLYGVPDWRPPTADGLSVHADDDGDVVGDHWFVVVDSDRGGGALVARKDGPGAYTGFWTFRPKLVADVVETIETDVRPRLRRIGE
ncbi:sensor protein [Halosimplex carlsbadense 2-9-1]|uniref:Sensor protein n=1 Tax=Halosimplex carlsbadense 2-9-1 TaxID=797114 RepID=M0CGN5_9EURY|nr:DICT sensory domain-containing protein [Halosimplex carlsbadense]ELZ22431.1 sensor protein [Halosimplex carlsbadense 2-9-1]